MELTPELFHKTVAEYEKIPGNHNLDSNSIREQYVNERNQVKTVEELLAFTKRWNPLYTMSCVRELIDISPEELSVISNTYDPMQVLDCMQKNTRTTTCDHINGDGPECAASFIIIPIMLLLAEEYSRGFHIPFNAALFQLCAAAKM